MAIIQRLDSEIKPQADHIMQVLLRLLDTLNNKSLVADSAFGAVGALANAVEDDFQKYMQAFGPPLFKALNDRDEPALLAMAIGLVSDITRALGPAAQPYCDDFMNSLLENLRVGLSCVSSTSAANTPQSTALGNQFKPAILQCFGDIAQAIGGNFENYLGVVGQVLQQAAEIHVDSNTSYDVLDYIVSLREGIVDAWAGAIIAMKSGNKTDSLAPFVPQIFNLLEQIFNDPNRSEALLRSSMGVLGDLSDAFPNGQCADYYRQEWVSAMVKETRTNQEHSRRTIETARWAREQVKRQTAGGKSRLKHGIYHDQKLIFLDRIYDDEFRLLYCMSAELFLDSVA